MKINLSVVLSVIVLLAGADGLKTFLGGVGPYGKPSPLSMICYNKTSDLNSEGCEVQMGDEMSKHYRRVHSRVNADKCAFAGLADDGHDWIQYSFCNFLKEGFVCMNRTIYKFNFTTDEDDAVQINLIGEETAEGNDSVDTGDDVPKYSPHFNRQFSFRDGRYVYVQDRFKLMDEVKSNTEKEDDELVLINTRRRRRRQTITDPDNVAALELELAVYVDQCLWNTYLERYGSDNAPTALKEYVDATIQTADLLWHLDSMSPRMRIKVVNYEVWQNQPELVPVEQDGDAVAYINNFCNFAVPKAKGYDHAMVLSGCSLRQNNRPLGGLAFVGNVCSDYSCSLINGGTATGYRSGFVVAHEIGHSVGMRHDSDQSFAETMHCSSTCCVMTPYSAGTSPLAQWSTCSKTLFHQTLIAMSSQNCLDILVSSEPLNLMPGQTQPDEAQCIARQGACSRFYPEAVADCTKLYCTNTNGIMISNYTHMRLDGSYCAFGKVCQGGLCVTASSPLTAVDGGWSAWDLIPEAACGGSNCSSCDIVGQIPLRVQVRRCDNPYPNNGGKLCLGNTVRGYGCTGTTCTLGADSTSAYQQQSCADKFTGSSASSKTECIFFCYISSNVIGRLWLPNGAVCEGGKGRCVNGQCLQQCQNQPLYYVDSVDECPTAVNCLWGEWSTWGSCTATCGASTQSRSRSIAQQPTTGGAPCVGPSTETQSCTVPLCAVDCGWSSWSLWSTCSKSCDVGQQTRTRSVVTEAANGGKACVDPKQDSQDCVVTVCAVPCIEGAWSVWSTCSAACGIGSRNRKRDIYQQPQNGGKTCDALSETQSCIIQECPTDCSLTQWSEWSPCSETCGTGIRAKQRSVIQHPMNGGTVCGELNLSETCEMIKCKVNCVPSAWSAWEKCSTTCGPGMQRRTRGILQAALYGGAPCDTLEQSQQCDNGGCPSACILSSWEAWGDCNVKCGNGTQARLRTVIEEAKNNGTPCGSLLETQPCVEAQCAQDCQLLAWSAWSFCTVTCGMGTQNRSRRVYKEPANGGKPCDALTEIQQCPREACKTDCVLDQWNPWSACTTSCGPGNQTRIRSVVQQPSGGGSACAGLQETIQCQQPSCAVDCVVTEWSDWSVCSVSCGTGFISRTRSVTRYPENGGQACGLLAESTQCAKDPCPIDCVVGGWTSWTSCSLTCGIGFKQRSRPISQAPAYGGAACSATNETIDCILKDCPVDCVVDTWGSWSGCSVTCGNGTTVRSRAVTQQPSNGGVSCEALQEQAVCIAREPGCKCQHSQWGDWGNCEGLFCQLGTTTRTRRVTFRGYNCTAALVEERVCETSDCPVVPVNCQYGSWQAWSVCTETCGDGTQLRYRSIVQEGRNGGTPCDQDLLSERATCNLEECPAVCSYETLATGVDSTIDYGQNKIIYKDVTTVDDCDAKCWNQSLNGLPACILYVVATKGNGVCVTYSTLESPIFLTANSPYVLRYKLCKPGDALSCDVCGYSKTYDNFTITDSDPGQKLGVGFVSDYMCQLRCRIKFKAECVAHARNPTTSECRGYRNQLDTIPTDSTSSTKLYQLKCENKVFNSDTTTTVPVTVEPDGQPTTTTILTTTTIAQATTTIAPATTTIASATTTADPTTLTVATTATTVAPTTVTVATTTATTVAPTTVTLATTTTTAIPAVCVFNKTTENVYPMSEMSANKLSKGAQGDCLATCQAETEFTCRGYLTMGAGKECIVLGVVDQTVNLQSGSDYNLYDYMCNGVITARQVCEFRSNRTSIASHVGLGVSENDGVALTVGVCEERCLLRFGNKDCVGFLYDESSKTKFCYLFFSIDSVAVTNAPQTGSAVLYVKECTTRGV